MDHRFLAAVLETAGFKPEYHRWISILYRSSQAEVQAKRKVSGSFAIERSVRHGYLLSPLLYTLALEPLLCRLRDEKSNPALIGVLLVGRVRTRVSAFADDITVFESCCSGRGAVKKVIARYEQVVGAKVNFDKSEGELVFPFLDPFTVVTVPSASLGCGSDRTSNWCEISRKYRQR